VFVIIVGGGKVGSYLTRALLRGGHEVVMVEKQERKAELFERLVDQRVALVGDGCDPLVLEQAGLKRADVVVADTGDDEDNLVVCLIATKNSKARCIARVNNPANKMIFESLNRENPITVISSTEIILDIISQSIASPA
jgi:trk system potassium uptake protein TrkA